MEDTTEVEEDPIRLSNNRHYHRSRPLGGPDEIRGKMFVGMVLSEGVGVSCLLLSNPNINTCCKTTSCASCSAREWVFLRDLGRLSSSGKVPQSLVL
jgi:hypothetical protein